VCFSPPQPSTQDDFTSVQNPNSNLYFIDDKHVYGGFAHLWSQVYGDIQFGTDWSLCLYIFECSIGAHDCSLISRKLNIHIWSPFKTPCRVYKSY
jgi:hypothetical protein